MNTEQSYVINEITQDTAAHVKTQPVWNPGFFPVGFDTRGRERKNRQLQVGEHFMWLYSNVVAHEIGHIHTNLGIRTYEILTAIQNISKACSPFELGLCGLQNKD